MGRRWAWGWALVVLSLGGLRYLATPPSLEALCPEPPRLSTHFQLVNDSALLQARAAASGKLGG